MKKRFLPLLLVAVLAVPILLVSGFLSTSDVSLGTASAAGDVLDAVEEILSVPGIDAVMVGPMDLAVSMGVSPTDPKIKEGYERVVQAASSSGVRVIHICLTPEEIPQWMGRGVQLFTYGVDTYNLPQVYGNMIQGCKRQVADAKRT